MIGKLLSFILDREPVASAAGIAGVVSAALGVIVALGADIDPEIIAAIGTLAAALAGWLARKRAWSPVSHEQDLARVRTATYNPPGPQTPTGEAGFSIVGVLVGIIVFFAAVFLIADACIDDEDEEDDLGLGPVATSDYDRDGDEGSRNRNGNDCQDAEAECHDNDFSPQFDESPVTLIVCVEPDSCSFG